jgi:hypothetical protein
MLPLVTDVKWIVVPVAEGSNPSTHPNKIDNLWVIRRIGDWQC